MVSCVEPRGCDGYEGPGRFASRRGAAHALSVRDAASLDEPRRSLPAPHARPLPRHLRHLHGRTRPHRARARPPGHGLGPQRVPADGRRARPGRNHADHGVRSGAALTHARCGGDRQRDDSRQSVRGAHSRPRAAICLRARVAVRARACPSARDRGGRHPRQDHDHRDARGDPRRRRTRSRIPGRRGAARLSRRRTRGCARTESPVRHRGRRVRHRLLRQAVEVHALPPAHPGAEQPRVRPRGHLRRPARRAAAVSSRRAHRAGRRPDRGASRGPRDRGGPGDGMLDSGGAVRRRRRLVRRHDDARRRKVRGAPPRSDGRRGRMESARCAQRLERARRDRGGRARGRRSAHRGTRARRLHRRQATARAPRDGGGHCDLRRLRASPDRDQGDHRDLASESPGAGRRGLPSRAGARPWIRTTCSLPNTGSPGLPY